MCECGKYDPIGTSEGTVDSDGQVHRYKPEKCDAPRPLVSNYLAAQYHTECDECDWISDHFTEGIAVEMCTQHSLRTSHSLVIVKSQRRFIQHVEKGK